MFYNELLSILDNINKDFSLGYEEFDKRCKEYGEFCDKSITISEDNINNKKYLVLILNLMSFQLYLFGSQINKYLMAIKGEIRQTKKIK